MNFKGKLKLIKNSIKKKTVKNLFLNYSSLRKEPLHVISKPLIVKIEPSTNCNLRCRMCDRTYWDKESKDMSFEDFKRTIDQIPSVLSINLQGLGEPLLNKDLFEMIEYAKSKDIEIGFFSNVTLINEEMARKIVESKLDYINLSVDATNEVYEKIRMGANFNNIIENIKTLIKVKGNKRYPHISIWVAGMKENINEVPKIVQLAYDLGIDEVVVQSINFWGKDLMKDKFKDKSLNENIGEAKKVLDEAGKLAEELDINLKYSTVYFTKKTKRACKSPWLTSYITVDGYVTPCCMQASDPRLINFGNVFEKSFEEIWNSEDYKKFRKELKKGMPKVCVDCPGYYYRSG